jgi:hypothetical protein
MTNHKTIASVPARVSQLIRQYNKVQEEASVESLRRFLLMVVFTIPMHFALAWWFNRYPADPAHPEVMEWAHSLGVLHGITGAIVLALACFVRWVVRPKGRATVAGVGLHILLCITYLVFGVFASQLDVKVAAAGGISPYIIVCIAIGVTSLMRPAISIPLFAGALAIFWVGLSMTNFAPVMFASLVINSTAATVLALIVSIMLWKQYVSISLLHQQLHNAQRALSAKQVELDLMIEINAQTQPAPLGPFA